MGVVLSGLALCGAGGDVVFFFNDTATTEIYTLSLHDALPICCGSGAMTSRFLPTSSKSALQKITVRSEERFSRNAETDLVCRLLLEKQTHPTPVQHATTPRPHPSTPYSQHAPPR